MTTLTWTPSAPQVPPSSPVPEVEDDTYEPMLYVPSSPNDYEPVYAPTSPTYERDDAITYAPTSPTYERDEPSHQPTTPVESSPASSTGQKRKFTVIDEWTHYDDASTVDMSEKEYASTFPITVGFSDDSETEPPTKKARKPRTKKAKGYNGRKYVEPFPTAGFSLNGVDHSLHAMLITNMPDVEFNSQLHNFSHEYRWTMIKTRGLPHPVAVLYQTRHASKHTTFCFDCHRRLFKNNKGQCKRDGCIKNLEYASTYNRVKSEIKAQENLEKVHRNWIVLRYLPQTLRWKFGFAITRGLN